MGFNISGIAVAKNLQNEIKEIECEIGFGLELIKEIDFETASSNWKVDGICDIYFGSNGTLIFLSHELSMEPYSILDLPTLTYTLSETSMAFCFHYCDTNKIMRSRAETEGQKLEEEGERLDIENTSINILDIIWKLIEKTINQNFNQIDLDEKCYRYRLVKIKGDSKRNNNKTDLVEQNLKFTLAIYKYSKWIIIIGLIFTILALTKVYETHFGILTILSGIIARRISAKYMEAKFKQ